MRIALTGNPNSGKTTLFNAITGRIEHVGNWAGVTIDKKEGDIKAALNKMNVDSILPTIYENELKDIKELNKKGWTLYGYAKLGVFPVM